MYFEVREICQPNFLVMGTLSITPSCRLWIFQLQLCLESSEQYPIFVIFCVFRLVERVPVLESSMDQKSSVQDKISEASHMQLTSLTDTIKTVL